jgi:hypothetical protein
MTPKAISLCVSLCVIFQSIPRQLVNRASQRKQGGIRIRVRRQPGIVMPHQFHRLALRHASPVQTRAERVPQRMKIHRAPLRIHLGNACFSQQQIERLRTRHQAGQHQIARCRICRTGTGQRRQQLRMQRQAGLLVVLADGSAHQHRRLFHAQIEIASTQPLQFTVPDSRQCRHHASQTVFARRL